MSNLKTLIKITKELNLIESTDGIDFLFLGFEFNEDEPLDNIIDKVLEWGYVNDKLEDFFLEHWKVLADTELITALQSCNITNNGYNTSFELYRTETKNKVYYKIESNGIDEDCLETDGFYDITAIINDKQVIENFKEECMNVYTVDGDFTEEECLENGSTIEFSD